MSQQCSAPAANAADTTCEQSAPASDHGLNALRDVIARLTAPDGCKWDRAQTPDSLTEYVIEESHELVSAIRSGNPEDVCEELGDVAFLLLFITHLYEKAGAFTLSDVLEKNAAKMIHRHPHVFAGEHFANLDEQLKAWERLKQEEHKAEGKPTGLFDSLPRTLEPLARAYRIHSKAARTGFTWESTEDVEQQVETEWLEYVDANTRRDSSAISHELGDLLFSIVELGRRHGLKANAELDAANERFLSRYRFMEEQARAKGLDLAALPLDEKDELWAQAKKAEQAGSEAADKTAGESARPALSPNAVLRKTAPAAPSSTTSSDTETR